MNDNQIILELKNGNENALKLIHKKFYGKLIYFCVQYVKLNEVAEEIVEDAFFKVWEHRDDFIDLDKLQAFLYVAVKNASINYKNRASNKIYKQDISEIENILTNDLDILKKVILSEFVSSVFVELEKLPTKQREIFLLSFVEGLSVEEIAQKMNSSTNAIYANKSRAISTLREKLNISNASFSILLSLLFIN